jgi:ubiquinone/menaquinone biosynthesis C-methylase UbiE
MKLFNFSIGKNNDLAREKWLKEILKKVPKGSRLLDAGAGQKRYKKYCSHLQYVSQDFGKYDGTGNGVGLQTEVWDQNNLDIVSDIVHIPVTDNSFDAVMCVEVFEHLPNPIAALAEFSRIIKPGGHLILTAPFACGTHFAPYFFYTGFSKYFYDTHLSKNNFDILEIKANGNFFDYLAQELRRFPFMAKKYARTRFTLFYKILIVPILFSLFLLSRKQNHSDDFMSFGYNVFSLKK